MPIVTLNTDNEGDTNTRELGGAYANVVAVVEGITYVVVAGTWDDGLSVLRLDAGGTLTPVFDLADSSQTFFVQPGGVGTATVGGATYIYVTAAGEPGLTALRLNVDGSLTVLGTYADSDQTHLANSFFSETVTILGTTYLYVSDFTENGITRFRVENDGALTLLGTLDDTTDTSSLLVYASGLASTTIGSTTFLVVAGEDGLSAFTVQADGNLVLASTATDDAATALGDGVAVDTATIDGVTYVYVASSAESGVSVFELGTTGVLSHVESVFDTDDARLVGALSVEVFTSGGAQYLAVAGFIENGISIFRINSGGTLTLDQSIDDTDTTFMTQSTQVVSAVVGGQTYLMTIGYGDSGISAFDVGAVVAPNATPTGQDNALTVLEDGRLVLTLADFGGVDSDGTITGVEITTLPGNGTLYIDTDGAGGSLGTAVTASTTIPTATFDAGQVVFVPSANTNAAGSFTFRVQDDGGTRDEVANTITLNVTAVNDAPTFNAPTFAISRVSVSASGAQAINQSSSPAFSPDGTKLAFASIASNLVAGDTNGTTDIFVKNLVTGAIELVSTTQAGELGNRSSGSPVFSPDGTKVAFSSFAENLVAGDTNQTIDLFVKDLNSGVVTRVSTDAAGAQTNRSGTSSSAIFSPDGTKLAFVSMATNLVPDDTNNAGDIFIKDLATGAVTRVSTTSTNGQANGASTSPVFSADGTKIAFASGANNVVDGDTNGVADIFVKDLVSGVVTRVSTAGSGAQAANNSITPVFSPDGTKIAFASTADNLVAGDTNGVQDIFVKDLVSGVVTRVSAAGSGAQATGASITPVFSPDGTKIAFASTADNLVAGDRDGRQDIFVKDLVTGAISRVSISNTGEGGINNSSAPVFSPDGARIAFASGAFNFVAGDTNNVEDIFVATLGSVGTPTFTENGAPVAVAPLVNIGDVDSANYAGGALAVALTGGSVTGDGLSIANDGGITVTGTSVAYNGTEIGILIATATTLSIALDADATDAAVKALSEAVRFASTSENPGAGARTVTFTLTDGGGTDNGGANSASFSREVVVTPVNDAPAGTDGGASVLDNEVRTFTVADFGFTDVDGNAFSSVIITTRPNSGAIFLRNPNGYSGTAGGQSFTVQQIADGLLFFQPDEGTGGTTPSFTFQVRDNGGTANRGVDLDLSPNTFTFSVVVVNDAPSVDLNSEYYEGNDFEAAYTEGGSPVAITDINVWVSDPDTDDNIEGATITIADALAGDFLSLSDLLPEGISIDLGSTATKLVLTGSASAADYQAALAQVRFGTTSDNPTAGGNTQRTITTTVTDGTASSVPATTIVTVTATNDRPVNTVPGAQNGPEDSNLVFSSGVGNAITVADPDSASLTVTLSVANGTLRLAPNSLAVTGDGTRSVTLTGSPADINAALNGLIYRGNLNYQGADTLTIATNDGTATDTDTVAIGLADDGTIDGDAGNNNLTGTPQNDLFLLQQGGDDIVTGQAGDDGFVFGAALSQGDQVDGGPGGNDQVGLQGDYVDYEFGARNLVDIEALVLISGEDTRFGEDGTGRYSYDLTTVDANVAAGEQLKVLANALLPDENLTFDGSAETDGTFFFYGGQGVDDLTGGALDDGFFFGADGRFSAADKVDGGGGAMDQLGLRGDYSNQIAFAADTMVNIEGLVLISSADSRFGGTVPPANYDIKLHDGNVAAGQRLLVTAAQLASDETLTFDGSTETDGSFRILGGRGNDVLSGGAGDDIIYGGARGDTLYGNGGNDIFLYRSTEDSNQTERDGIQDFTLGDIIDLSAIDADSVTAGDQAFSFIGEGVFTGEAGELRFENSGGSIWTVSGDTNGDGQADFQVILVTTDNDPITAGDFNF